ncbi:MAG: hypothetical protein BEN19_02550 [Epulopiscium sp. Nuni2H_MBin003]|nr:MAG: hypothetical protein BEN19_02550 [Epulopiscium sp. Nuni2H_MBin003]
MKFLVAYISTVAFSGMFNVPQTEFLFCGLGGSVCYIVNHMVVEKGHQEVTAAFFATIVLAFICRILAVYRKMPLTVFLVPGIFPIVPGSYIYFTAYYFISGETINALQMGLETAKIAIGVALGILLALALPQSLFNNMIPRKG